MIEIVNVKTHEYDIYIGRSFKRGKYNFEESIFSNPFRLSDFHNRNECLKAFEDYFYNRINNDLAFRKAVLSLRDCKLGCWCKPQSCHGDIIKEFVDNQPQTKMIY